jgi:hypothetical protein
MRHRAMNARSLASVLCVVATVVVACSGQQMSTVEVGATRASTAEGRLTGRLVTVGGPAPGATHPVAGTVTVSGHGVHVEIAVGEDGAYALSLPPGRYRVTGRTPSVVVNGREAPCPSAKAARVTRDAAAVLDALCSIR